MKIKLERLIMRNDIIFKRSVQFRDENKNSWTVDFEVYKEESTRINRETLQKFKQSFSVSVCGAGGMSAGQCYDHIIPRTEGQKKLLEFWSKYHLGGMSGGTIRQDEYLNGEQYVNDYNYFVELFKTYNEHYREQFDDISFQILVKNFNISDVAIIQVRNVLYEKMRNNPIQYILGLSNKYFHTSSDYNVKCFFLAIKGLYVDNGYKYGNGWLYSPLPDNIEEIINNICDLVEEEETALTEELEAVFDMGKEGFIATKEIIQQVMDLRECDEDEAKRFVALGVHLGCTFGDLNDTFEECSYGEQLYCANGIDYYIGTEDELTNIASDRVHNDDEYAYLWRESVAAQGTTDSLSDWLDSIISEDGWCSVLNSWDGRYEEYKIAEEYICVCRS
jgi:hypothetical protein